MGNDSYSYLKSVWKYPWWSSSSLWLALDGCCWKLVLDGNNTDNTLENSSYSFHKLQICPLREHIQQEDVQGLPF